MIELNTEDFTTYYKPSRCERRLYLFEHPPKDYEQNVSYIKTSREADDHHIRRYMKQLPHFKDLSKLSREESEEISFNDIENTASEVLYKPIFSIELELEGLEATIFAQPDFMFIESDQITLRQCKMAKKITRDNHPDTLYSLQCYGWILEQLTDKKVILEVFNTQGKFLSVSPGKEEYLFERLYQLMDFKSTEEEPYVPVSWTRCQDCLFKSYCWDKAKRTKDISLLPNLEKSLLLSLRDNGIVSVPQLLEKLPLDKLAEFEWDDEPLGEERAKNITLMAQSLESGRPILTATPTLPDPTHWVMFDVEGVPAQPTYPERIYLWGLYLKGAESENLQMISRQFSKNEDRNLWFAFLEQSETLFEACGDVPFVHWGSYEPNCIKMYIERYGDKRHIGQRILDNLLDFWQLLKDSIIIPLPSYSLKVLEQYVGFERPDKEFSGYWSVVSYLKSTSTRNRAKRNQIQEQLLDYNQADLEAMWHIIEWFKQILEDESK